MAGLWKDEDARLLKVDADGNFFTTDDGTALRLTRPFVEYDPNRHFLLGLLGDGSPVFTVEALADGPMRNLREVGAVLSPADLEVATAAVAILNWHRHEGFCPRCGHPTLPSNGGFMRRCEQCGNQVFPRNDSAVIVAVLDPSDRILLGHQRTWPEKRVSILAGFVEAGESLEHAVHREMAEEADVDIVAIDYFGSQPWPFPRSLMVGFFARTDSDHVSVDEQEIQWARWFTRDEVRAAVRTEDVLLPMPASIAHRMISHWLDA